MNILEAHETRRQFLRTLVGGVALAAVGPSLSLAAQPPRMTLTVDGLLAAIEAINREHASLGWPMNPKMYRMIRDIKVKQDWYAKRHDERLARRVALGLPVGQPCA